MTNMNKRPENDKLTNMRLSVVFDALLFAELDKVLDHRPDCDEIVQGKVLKNVATISLHGVDLTDRVVTLAIFENGTYKIMSSTTVFGTAGLEAYARALAVIKQLQLVDFTR